MQVVLFDSVLTQSFLIQVRISFFKKIIPLLIKMIQIGNLAFATEITSTGTNVKHKSNLKLETKTVCTRFLYS